MNNAYSLRQSVHGRVTKKARSPVRANLIALLALLVITSATQIIGYPQSYGPASISWISSRLSPKGTVVLVSADRPLSKPQTWQDAEGFHVVIPNATVTDSLKGPQGVKFHAVGDSVEIALKINPGAQVSVIPSENHLNLLVSGELDTGTGNQDPGSTASTSSGTDQRIAPVTEPARENPKPVDSSSTSPTSASSSGTTQTNATAPETAPTPESTEDEGLFASILTNSSVLVLVSLGLITLLITRKVRSRRAAGNQESQVVVEKHESEEEVCEESIQLQKSQGRESRTSMVKANRGGSVNASSNERKTPTNMPVAAPASFYGAYRIDQEVGKLILGQPHRMDVLSSRAPDDRRAIETSLVKVMTASDSDENQRRRAREALEEYGFVARQCASLLLAPEAFDRTSAARALGEMRSAAALPFLLEGLHDQESIVRNQTVVSLGELKLPSAIGALLDMARTHPDVPSTLLSRALSACSVEGLDFFDASIPQVPLLSLGQGDSFLPDITHLEPASLVEDLPAGADDEQVREAIAKLGSSDGHERAEAVKTLAPHSSQSSVTALSAVARIDSEASIRALAIASLAAINHESVFPAVLIGLADESREVRAASARSLSRLSFDRVDAYVRVLETADETLLRDVGHACIQAGIVSQNLDRLASSDHRQAYETFTLISLLARARMIEPILEAISNHHSMSVRVAAVHLLATTGEPVVLEQLRQLAIKDEIAEEVKTALLEAMYKLEQSKPKIEEPPPPAIWISNETDESPYQHYDNEKTQDEVLADYDATLKKEPHFHLNNNDEE